MSIMNALGPLLIQASSVYGGVEEGRQKAATEKREREERERKALIEQALLDLRRDNAQLDREKFDYERTKPEDVNWQLGEDASGYFERNPRTGAIRRPEGLTPKPPEPSAASQRPTRWATVQTDEGILQIDPTTGQTRAPTGPSGRPLQPRAASAQKVAAIQNRRQMSVIDRALEGIERHPRATGIGRGVSDMVDQRVDPEGVSIRADIADVGSLIIHQRSGAAVTVSEWPRLAPFVPRMTDNAETVKAKLQRLREILEEETIALESGGTTDGTGGPTVIPDYPDNPY